MVKCTVSRKELKRAFNLGNSMEKVTDTVVVYMEQVNLQYDRNTMVLSIRGIVLKRDRGESNQSLLIAIEGRDLLNEDFVRAHPNIFKFEEGELF